MLTMCGHLLCRDCLLSTAQFAGELRCPVCRAPTSPDDIVYLPGSEPAPPPPPGARAPPTGTQLVDVEEQFRSSTKIDLLCRELKVTRCCGEGGDQGSGAHSRGLLPLLPATARARLQV